MTTEGLQNDVGLIYRQQVLSGYEHINQPQDKDGDSPQDEQRGEAKLPKQFWKSQSHQISISLIIEKVSTDGDEHKFRIRLTPDADVLIASYARQSKRLSKERIAIPGTSGKKTLSLPVVYGIHESGLCTLSPTDGCSLPEFVASVYSFVLGQADRAIERIILESQEQATDDDTGKRPESDGSPQVMGSDKAKGRRRQVLPKVRNETVPETDTALVDEDRPILGSRLSDFKAELARMGNDIGDGGGIANVPVV